MKLFALALLMTVLGGAGPAAHACAWCRPRVQAGIHNAAYTANLLLVLLPVAVLLLGGLGLFFADIIRRRLTPPQV